jgi:hypothetical protein
MHGVILVTCYAAYERFGAFASAMSLGVHGL